MILETRSLAIDNYNFLLVIKRSARGKQIRLSIPKNGTKAVLSLPKGVSVNKGMTFYEKSNAWVLKHLKARQETQSSTDFQTQGYVDFLGEKLILEHTALGKISAPIHLENKIIVKGPKEHINWLVERWLKDQAQDFMERTSRQIADKLGVTIAKITIKDMTSRWGSCSPEGNIAYSWRVIMAPRDVAFYLCVHEVCHRLEMNHSKRFWALVQRFCPNYKTTRAWLKNHGKRLF